MRKSILFIAAIAAVFSFSLGWVLTYNKANAKIENYTTSIDSLQNVIDLRTKELESCARKLSAKEKGVRLNTYTDQYERLEWVTRRFDELNFEVGDTIAVYPAK